MTGNAAAKILRNIADAGLGLFLGNVDPTIGELNTQTRSDKQYPYCTRRTNTGSDAAILVSSAENGTFSDFFFGRKFNKLQLEALRKYLVTNERFDEYPVGVVRVIEDATSEDLRAAILDESIASIALIGHSSKGVWVASDREVTWVDVRGYVNESGHCKNGFGLNTGCNHYTDRREDSFYFLAPAFGHSRHPGALYLCRSKTEDEEESHGLSYKSKLWRIRKLSEESGCW